MKLKRRIGIGLAVAAAIYCVLAYIFMWPPVVTYTRPDTPASPCINNLRQIDAAIHQWTLEHLKREGETVTLNDITPCLKLSTEGKIPSCPIGGVYSVSRVGQPPVCSLGTATNIPNNRIRVGYFHWKWSGWNDNANHKLD